MLPTHSLGSLGEKLAADYLRSKGYQILETNYHIREGEIDIICEQNNCLVFVEVKTRTNQAFGWPEDAVNDFKLEKILAAAFDYLQHHDINADWRVDVISIIRNRTKNVYEIKRFQDIGV